MNGYLINTGVPRHVGGHMVSSGLALALSAGVVQYSKNQDAKAALKSGIKKGLQGAIAAGVAIDVANRLGNPYRSKLGILGALGLGALGIYAIERGIKDEK